MPINPDTLYCLYRKGILDYVPQELLIPTPISSFSFGQNPYMNMAMQGNLYQQYGLTGDNFMGSNMMGMGMMGGGMMGLGGYSPFGGNYMNGGMFGSNGFDSSFSGSSSMYGGAGMGMSGANMTGGTGMTGGTQGINGMNGYGVSDGINSVQGALSGGINKFKQSSPLVKGLIAAPILLFTIMHCFKTKRKPKNTKGVLSKINPMNIFKKQKPKPAPVKKSFWNRLKGKI